MASTESKTVSKKSKRHRDEKEDNGTTNKREESDKNETAAVHSANSWEKVDLGDDDRKNKFLRLMGAAKKEHHGRFVIGESRTEHGRSKEEVEKLTEDLEEQYEQGMGLRLSGAARRHKGLGFQEANDSEDQYCKGDGSQVPEEPTPAPVEKSEDEDRPKKKKSKKDKDRSGVEEEVKSKNIEEKPKAKSLLGFVKASSS